MSGDLKEMILAEEGINPKIAAINVMRRNMEKNEILVLGKLVYVSELGFGDEKARPEAILFRLDDILEHVEV
jgi:hypothetical protein